MKNYSLLFAIFFLSFLTLVSSCNKDVRVIRGDYNITREKVEDSAMDSIVVMGKILSKSPVTNKLKYGKIHVEGTKSTTYANNDGRYQIKLVPGNYKFTFLSLAATPKTTRKIKIKPGYKYTINANLGTTYIVCY